jgi:AAA+ superfamily predicted ATPase
MKFKQFMDLYDNWNGRLVVNSDYLHPIVIDVAYKIMDCIPSLAGVKSYEKLFDMEVVAFGFYDDELCVRVK